MVVIRPRAQPEWMVVKKTLLSETFSRATFQGIVACMDPKTNTLYVPVLEGSFHLLPSNLLPTEVRAACVKTIAQVLAVVLAHHETNISSLLVDSCTPSLCNFRYKDVLALVDLARRRSVVFPFGKLALEARIVSENSQLSSCKFHPQASRVCPQCFHQSDTTNVSSDCPHCMKQYLSLQPPKPSCPPPTNYDVPDPPPSPPSFASMVKAHLSTVDNSTPPPIPPSLLFKKVNDFESQLIAQQDNNRSILDQLYELSKTQNSYAEKLSQLEEASSWRETKHKSCQSIKKVDSNAAALKRLHTELAVLTSRVNVLTQEPPTQELAPPPPPPPPLEIVNLPAQINDLNRQMSDMQAALLKQLQANPPLPCANTLSPDANTPSATAKTPPSPTSDPLPDDILNI